MRSPQQSPSRSLFARLGGATLATVLAVTGLGVVATSTASSALAERTVQPSDIIQVTTTDDCATAGCGSLRAAIDAANLASADSLIVIEGLSGTITLTADLPSINRTMSIVGPGSNLLTIDGDGQFQAFDSMAMPGDHLELIGMRITNCFSLTPGAAISAGVLSLGLHDIVAENNLAGDPMVANTYGGALAVSTTGDVLIENSVFRSNATIADIGSSDHAGAISMRADNITILNTLVTGSESTYDGAVALEGSTSLVILNSSFTDSRARIGTGTGTFFAPSITFLGVRISGSSASAGVAGSVINAGSIATLTDVRYDHNGNDSADYGAGYVVGPTLVLTGVTVDHNAGIQVGGFVILGGATIVNSTISDNVGIGLLVNGIVPVELDPQSPPLPASLTVSHSTITNNTAHGIATAIYTCDTSIAGLEPATHDHSASVCELGPSNTVPTVVVSFTIDHVIASGNGLFDIFAPAVVTWSLTDSVGPEVELSTGTIQGDPGIDPLTCLSDLVCVRPVPVGAAVWNAGDPAFSGPPTIDQTGAPRIVDVVDMGAYENQTPIAVPAFTG